MKFNLAVRRSYVLWPSKRAAMFLCAVTTRWSNVLIHTLRQGEKGRAALNFKPTRAASTSAPEDPLRGVRILDLTRILAGPYCSMILGDLGAEIIKIERPGVGDETRNWGPPFLGDQSCYFLSVNRNKKSVAINFKKPEGARLVKKLAGSCDVLVENYLPGKLDSLGLGYQDIKAVAPQIVYCSITVTVLAAKSLEAGAEGLPAYCHFSLSKQGASLDVGFQSTQGELHEHPSSTKGLVPLHTADLGKPRDGGSGVKE